MIEIVTEQELKKEEMGMICSEMNSLLRQSHAVKTYSNFGETEFKFKANFIFKNEAETIWLLGSRLCEFSSFTYNKSSIEIVTYNMLHIDMIGKRFENKQRP